MSDEIWLQDFPYREGTARVARLRRGWRLTVGAGEAEATTLVEAFEQLLRRAAGAPEMQVVMAALAWERAVDSGADEPELDVVDGEPRIQPCLPEEPPDDQQSPSA